MTDVSTVSKPAKEMHECAQTPRTLMGGTDAMRKAADAYLPKERAESDAAYNARLKRSFLFNAFGKTVSDMTGKVFDKPVVLEDDVPASIQTWAENIDLTGRHINVFARDVFYDAMQPGIGFILTDMPPAIEGANLQQEQEAGNRPYLVYIPVERVLGWQSTMEGGAETLTQFRFTECESEPDGEFGEKDVEQIRVLEPGKWRTFRKSNDAVKGEQWLLYAEGTTSLDKIAISPVYINRENFMTGKPPLAKLAELNVAHWQSSSDQRNILHVARVPILFMAGFNADDTIEIGSGRAVRSSATDAKMGYVEHTGAAISSGQTDITELELQMQNMGLQLLMSKPSGQSATGEIRDDSKENSMLAMMARALGDAIESAFGFMAEFANLGKDGGSVMVNTDFGVAAQRTDLQQLVAARAAGDLSRETLWNEMQRRDYLSDSFDPDLETERLASEAPALNAAVPMNLDANGVPVPAPVVPPKVPVPAA